MREPIHTITSAALVLPVSNIDTDQIIPARFLTTTSRAGLGEHAFADWRGVPDSPLSDPRAAGCRVLVAGDNFGCGSSREHAPWALLDLGLRAVISTSFADIFRSNAVKNGLLPVVVPAEFHAALVARPWAEVTVDLDAQRCSVADLDVGFPIDAYERDCLRSGRDDLDQLLARRAEVQAYEEARS